MSPLLLALLLAAPPPTPPIPSPMRVTGLDGGPVQVICVGGTCSGGGGGSSSTWVIIDGGYVGIWDGTRYLTLLNAAPGSDTGQVSVPVRVISSLVGGAGGTASSFTAAFPASGTAAGFSDGTNMQGGRVFDYDTGAGTQYVLACGLRKSASGGSVELGTSADPVRVDPTGTTTQPISAAALPLPTGASTSGLQTTGNTSLSSIDTKTPALVSGRVPVDGSGVTQPVSGPLTDTQLRASAVPVSGSVTATGPLTDTQLRASAVPVSLSSTTCNAGSNLNTSALALDATLTGGTQKAIARGGAKGATAAADVTSTANGADHQGLDVQLQNASIAVTGPLTDTQLRASAVPVSGTVTASGPLTDTQLRASAVPVSGTFFQATQPVSGTVAVTQSGTWSDRVVGNAGGAFDSANNAAAPANVIADGFEAAAQGTTQPTAATAGNMRRAVVGTDGVLYVRQGGPVQWSCLLQAVTATTQCRAAPAAGLRAYVTGMSCSNQAATVQTLDIVFGTGTNCGTGTTALTHKWQMGTVATTTSPFFIEWASMGALVPTAANAICVRPSAATAFGCTLTGYDAP